MAEQRLQLVPPDHAQRRAALNTAQPVLVQAPAGSGKTSLLTQRFLALLGEVDDPGEIVAITFTRAAAAEMQSRILGEMERAAAHPEAPANEDPLSAAALARRALKRSHERGWNLLDQPSQLRISTIDSFCRDLALQQPLVSGLGGSLEIAAQPEELYRRAARRTLQQLDSAPALLQEAAETLLLWRDNNWAEMEAQLVKMLRVRDRWMRDFVLQQEPDMEALRARLERPFASAVAAALERLHTLLQEADGACEEILELARFACEQTGGGLHGELAQLAEFPQPPFEMPLALADAHNVYGKLASFLLTKEGGFRRKVDKTIGFPADRKPEKQRMLELLASLATVPKLAETLEEVRALPPARYTEDEWRIVRAAFTLLAHAAAQLRIVFAEEGACDFIEIAQMALAVLKGEQGVPDETTLALVEEIRHLLIDEFQDTSRRQHELLAHLVAAWPGREGRTCFVVGDPMQSIYFFRDADAELFARVRTTGLELPDAEPLTFAFAQLQANFRTAPELVKRINGVFAPIFAEDDGSGIEFAAATPARTASAVPDGFAPGLQLHLEFVPEIAWGAASTPQAQEERKRQREARAAAQKKQTDEMVTLIALHQKRIAREQAAAAEGSKQKKYRVAVLGRTRNALAPLTAALHAARIPFRAVDLENLQDRPEIADALALARALMHPLDRVAWLGVLRAPWCALSLADLHALTSADDPQLLTRAIPELIAERKELLAPESRVAVERVLCAVEHARALRAASPVSTLGTWLQQAWTSLGGPLCVDATAKANLDLLWKTLDGLPEGEQDLLGPALDVALASLTAQPDPNVDEQCGVQLMTIHKSKGLEFEVVIVPELQAGSGRQDLEMLSWLERGVENPEAAEEPTEFLVAPLQARGTERGTAKGWVDRTRRTREQQEMRRLLYVAATRAREDLHLFARPAYKREQDGTLRLATPRVSLLKTAWPALSAEIAERFAEEQERLRPAEATAEPGVLDLAAAAAPQAAQAAPASPIRLYRLPAQAAQKFCAALAGTAVTAAVETPALYERHEGGLRSRALGTAVHSLLEELARLRVEYSTEKASAALAQFTPRAAAAIRSAGLEREQAEALAAEALHLAQEAAKTQDGEWVLSPHVDAASEQRWTGVLSGALRTVQVDRVFRAGVEPCREGDGVWWIVDYKTAHPESLDPQMAVAALRTSFAPQLATYAQVLRHLKGAEIEIRAALYYPRLKALDWWAL